MDRIRKSYWQLSRKPLQWEVFAEPLKKVSIILLLLTIRVVRVIIIGEKDDLQGY